MKRVPWFEKTFDFDFPVERRVGLLRRIREAPARIRKLVSALTPEDLTRRDGDAWSIQENVGHLLDLEDLHLGRLRDYEAGAPELRPADLSNRRSHEAHHNDDEIETLLDDFAFARSVLVERLEALGPQAFEKVALHPRLGRPMRIVDMMQFVVEHDAYHVERIEELAASFPFREDARAV